MKKDIHPTYGHVAFRDRSTGSLFVTRSTLVAGNHRTTLVGGEELPVVDVDITSDSHPFWTRKARTLDTEGRVQAFRRRYGGDR